MSQIDFDLLVGRELDGHMAYSGQRWEKPAAQHEAGIFRNLEPLQIESGNAIRNLYSPRMPSSRVILLKAASVPVYGITPGLIPWV